MGDLDIDLVHHMATLAGSPMQLTAKEFELLAYLARHAGKVCTHHMILKDVWGPGYGAESNYVRVYTHRLRKKMGDEDGQLLKTVPGVGYQLVADAHDAPRRSRAGCGLRAHLAPGRRAFGDHSAIRRPSRARRPGPGSAGSGRPSRRPSVSVRTHGLS